MKSGGRITQRINIETLKYPIGKYIKHEVITDEMLVESITEIGKFAQNLKRMALNFGRKELGFRYREHSWTIREIIHHGADSHMNAYIRIKLALTEPNPTIKPYDENLWTKLYDVEYANVESSLLILEGLHKRWSILLASLSAGDLDKTFYHPESKETVPIREAICHYAWHGKHHLAQIKNASMLKY